MAALGNFIGQSWSLWPPGSVKDGINIVGGSKKIASDILSVLLLRGGEDLIHWNLGWAPDMFDSMSLPDTQYWVYNAQQEIWKWVPGLASPPIVEIAGEYGSSRIPFPDPENGLTANIIFTPASGPDSNVLTFGWYAYTGAIWNKDLATFRQGLTLNGAPFDGLSVA